MPAPVQNVLTVNLEDYFQVSAFNRYVQHGQWARFESRLNYHVGKTLDLLDKHGVRATFFTLGWTAERFPEIVRAVAARGHEVASRGYYHRRISSMTPEEFRKDLALARTAIENASGYKVYGFRVADGWLQPDDLWVLDVLAEEGYAYDSSICPIGISYSGDRGRRFAHVHRTGGSTLWEFPLSTARFLGVDLPIAGGNWIRQLPRWMMRSLVNRWTNLHDAPLVMYFHTWELDTEQPRLSTARFLTKIRHYRNIHQMEDRLGRIFSRHQFVGVGDYLKLPRQTLLSAQESTRTPAPGWPVPLLNAPGGLPRTPITIVVPMYNEELLVPYLCNTLVEVRNTLQKEYDIRFLLVDDGSTDKTWDSLTKAFGERTDVKLVRHELNQGVSAAIMTGVRNAGTEIVCSMDADCSYDPIELIHMVPKLTEGVDMVTASPYHPSGTVANVPGWRLLLSKIASRMYRLVLRTKLSTYTSCFRVYRKGVVSQFPLVYGNFLGIAELLGRLDIAGGKIVEHPATLQVRMLGRSKMKTMRTILGHLGLLSRLTWIRIREIFRPSPPLEHRNKTIKHLIAAASKPDPRFAKQDMPATGYQER